MNGYPTMPCTVVLAVLLFAAGCAPTFSQEALDQVDRSISFREVQNKPEQYQGKSVMFGGVILEARNTAAGSSLEVLQTPLGRQGRPGDADRTIGRFILESPEYLDPAVYVRGKKITVIGEVKGLEVRPLGEMNYRYPVLSAREIKLWEPQSGPRFSFGIGIFHQF